MLFFANVHANQIEVTMYSTKDPSKKIGNVIFKDTDYGLLIIPNLGSLPPGLKGFHVHQNAKCGNQGKDAGGHLDTDDTKTHLGPYKEGHLGDLPALCVNDKGVATLSTLAPRLTTKTLKGHALIIHEHGDTYSDKPSLGGGGARIACGVF